MASATTLSGDFVQMGVEFPSSAPALGQVWQRLFPTETALHETAEPAGECSDAAWIARVRAGDEDAACALVRRLYPTVIKLIRCRLPRRTSEEDLAQTVFAKIFSKLDQFSGAVPLEHWVSRIVVNTCFSQLRHELMRPELRMSDLSEGEETVVQQLVATDQDLPGSSNSAARELMDKLLDRISAEERLVITLLHIEEKSVRQISQITGWSSTAVKVRAFRARRRMRKLWKTLLQGSRE